MVKIHTHRYKFQILKNKNITHQFIIVFPYVGNEKAPQATKQVQIFATDYLSKKGLTSLNSCDYTMEYLETKLCDDIQAIKIKLDGYSVIPFDDESGLQTKDETL